MSKKVKILVIAVSMATVLAISVGVAFAANDTVTANKIGQGNGALLGRQGFCSDTVGRLLGMTEEEIRAERGEGKSLVQIAATKGVSEQELIEAIIEERKAQIQERVADGTLTQERADIMFQQMEQNISRAINRTTIGQPEWAGTNGFDNGPRRNQAEGAGGACYGEPGLGTGPGNMHKWGRNSQ